MFRTIQNPIHLRARPALFALTRHKYDFMSEKRIPETGDSNLALRPFTFGRLPAG
jgi:hypothetical protein